MSLLLNRDAYLGQVWTPDSIAQKMARLSLKFYKGHPKTIVDPACGPGTFFKALSPLLKSSVSFISYDVDKRWVDYTKKNMRSDAHKHKIYMKDYLKDWDQGGYADILIMNPPYIRQERISEEAKDVYLNKVQSELNYKLDRRSNLFIYFFAKAIKDVRRGGVISAIVYDTLDNTRYGAVALKLINRHCETLYQEKILTPFDGVLVDATILILKVRDMPIEEHEVSNGNIVISTGFVNLSELVNVQRGMGLPNRSIFSASESDKDYSFSEKFVSKQRKLDGLFFEESDVSERAYIFEKESDIPQSLKRTLLERIESLGLEQVKLAHRKLSSPIIFNYYIRNHPRHLLNVNLIPASDNFYLIKPKAIENLAAWLLLNTTYYLESLMDKARGQGNGLKKLQLYEYKEAIVPDWRLLPTKDIKRMGRIAHELYSSKTRSDIFVKKCADDAVKSSSLWEIIRERKTA